jgi:hypothetical protein
MRISDNLMSLKGIGDFEKRSVNISWYSFTFFFESGFCKNSSFLISRQLCKKLMSFGNC